MKNKLTELQNLYGDALITNEIKAEAWGIRGITGEYFRQMVTGLKTDKKPFSDDNICGCLQALKQAIKNDTSRRNKFAKKIETQVA